MKRTERRAEQRGGGRFNQARPNHRDDGCRECDDRDQKAYEETTECVCLYRARQIQQQQQKEIEDVDDGIEKEEERMDGWRGNRAEKTLESPVDAALHRYILSYELFNLLLSATGRYRLLRTNTPRSLHCTSTISCM